MGRYLLLRAPSLILVLVLSSVVAFALPRLAPGDPAVVMAGADPTPSVVNAIRQQMGLNRPFWLQYFSWVGNLLHGNLGQSYILHRPVAQVIAGRVDSTIELATLAMLLMVALGLVLGTLGGSVRSARARTVLDVFNTVFLALPPFLTGLLLILLLGIAWPVLPVSGEVSFISNPEIGIQYLILPATALALPGAAVIARLLQTSMLQVRGEDFVDLATAKGVSTFNVIRRHVLRNSLDSVVVVIGLRIGELLGGAIVVESIFARNGLGYLAVTSVQSRDYTVVQVLILGAVCIAVIIQVLSEVVLAALDPRIRLEG